MIGAAFILTNKAGDLYVKLNIHKGRKVWEFVDDIHDASTFESSREIERNIAEHRCPVSMFTVRDYNKALSEWLLKPKNNQG